MDMNIIKEYVISLGFKFNEDTYNQFQQTMKNAEGNIKNFANNNKDNMSSLQKFFQLFNGSLKDNMGIVSKILPEAKAPFLQIINLVDLLYKGITKVSQGLKNVKTDELKEDNIKKSSETMQNFSKKTKESQESITRLKELIRELNEKVNRLSYEFSNINSDRLKESQESVIKLISLIKELNIQVNELSSLDISKITLNNTSAQALKDIVSISNAMKDLNIKAEEFSSKFKNIKSPNIPIGKENISKELKEVKYPINQLLDLFRKLNSDISKFSDSLKNIKPPELVKQKHVEVPLNQNSNIKNETFNNLPAILGVTSKALEKVSENSDDAKKSLLLLGENGGKAVEDLAKTSKVSLGVMAAGFATVVATVVSAWKTLTGLAKQDLGYQKLAMQLWTTKENAREVDMALKTMKISMQDLWLSPELLQQFNQLRQDSSQLKLPSDAEDKLKLVRSIVFEFKRLKQAGSLAFQWIGYYISKYAAGPLADMHQSLNKFVNWVLKNIPEAAKIIGTILGVLFRLILDAIQTIGIVLKPIINTISFIIEVIGKIPAPLKAIIALVIALEIALSTGPLGILLLIIAALDDIFTYFRGGKSVIGGFFDKFKDGANAIKDIKNGWNDFWGGIENFIDRIREKVKKLIKEIKDIPLVKGINDIKNLPGDIKSKVEGFAGSVKKGASSIKSYILPQSNTVNNKNSTSTQTNHNNTTNNFNIYGTTPTGTANAINSKINNGIKTRNLQGVIG